MPLDGWIMVEVFNQQLSVSASELVNAVAELVQGLVLRISCISAVIIDDVVHGFGLQGQPVILVWCQANVLCRSVHVKLPTGCSVPMLLPMRYKSSHTVPTQKSQGRFLQALCMCHPWCTHGAGQS